MTTRYYNPDGKTLDEKEVTRFVKKLFAYRDIEFASSNGIGDTLFHIGQEKTTLGIYDLSTPAAGIRGSIQIIGDNNDIHLTQQRLEAILGTKLVEVLT